MSASAIRSQIACCCSRLTTSKRSRRHLDPDDIEEYDPECERGTTPTRPGNPGLTDGGDIYRVRFLHSHYASLTAPTLTPLRYRQYNETKIGNVWSNMSDARRRYVSAVSGVYYRATTRERAQDQGVNGWVRNLDDGRVEAVFEGPDADVEAMVEFVTRGANART